MGVEFTLQDEFKLEGYWRLPSWPENREVRGSVEYSPQDGITLTVEGALEESIELKGSIPISVAPQILYEAIHGRTLDRVPITILKALGSGISNIPGLSGAQRRYYGQWLIVGDLVEQLSEWRHTSISVRYHNLEEFVGRQPLSVPMTDERNAKLAATFETPTALKGSFGGYSVSTEHHGLLTND